MSGHREVERKFDVAPGVPLPDLSSTGAGIASVGEPVETHLEATYFDTADRALGRRGITLRRRTGGDDAGWHLKLRGAGADERLEIRRPLGRSTRSVPKPLLDEVRGFVRDRPLTPVAVLRTTRVERSLRDADGTVLASVADDMVQAERPVPDGVETAAWREVEVELVDGHRPVLEAATRLFRRSGMPVSASASKLTRALGDVPRPDRPAPTGTAAASMSDYLAEHVEALLGLHRLARAGDVDGVHDMRVATRRLRSALATFRPLLDRAVTDPVRDELKWLGARLGSARDGHVQQERLEDHLARQPTDLVVGPVRRRVARELRDRDRAAMNEVRQTLAEDRYLRLLDTLEDLVADLPCTEAALEPAAQVLPSLVGAAVRRVRKRVRAVDAAQSGTERDAALHETRKAAKRARYAAESAIPVAAKDARRLAKRMKAVQQVLGEHQDSVTARRLLLDLATAAHEAGESSFTYGVLEAEEIAAGRAARARFPEVLRRATRRRVVRWTR